jgi:hypothetical protein
MARHVALLESDGGNGEVRGFSVDMGYGDGRNRSLLAEADKTKEAEGLAKLRGFADHLAPLGAGKFELGGSGADIGPSVRFGVPGIGVDHDVSRYWEIHHTWADTFDKVDKKTLQKNTAAVATLAFLLAEMPGTLR